MKDITDVKLKASVFLKSYWYGWKANPDNSISNMSYACILSEDLDISAFEQALARLVALNPCLRSVFCEKSEELYQCVYDNVDVSLERALVSSPEEKKKAAAKFIEPSFNLETGPLFRFLLIKRKYDNQYTFVMVIHHAFIDGVCFNDLFKELGQLYRGEDFCREDAESVSELASCYEWINKKAVLLTPEVPAVYHRIEEEALTYDAGDKKPTDTRKAQSASCFSFVSGMLSDETYHQVAEFAKGHNYSEFSILKTAWMLVIARYAGQKKVALTYPMGTRSKKFNSVKGGFVNLIFDFYEERGSFLDQIKGAEYDFKKAVKSQRFLPAYKTYEMLGVKFGLSGCSVYPQASFAAIQFPDTNIEVNLPLIQETLPHSGLCGLLLQYFKMNGNIEYRVSYDTNFFTEDRVKDIVRHYEKMILRLLANPEKETSAFSLLNDQEYERIVYDYNKNDADYPRDKTIQQVFEETVSDFPSRDALIYYDEKYTYSELNIEANKLANNLRKEYRDRYSKDISPDTLIGLYVDRTPQMIIAILGILKAGGAYVALDISEPSARTQKKLENSKCSFVLTDDKCEESFLECDYQKGKVFKIKTLQLDGETGNPKIINKSTDLAYVLYTSGSTGEPKGVMVEHYGVNALICDNARQLNVNEETRILQYSAVSFDVSVFTLFCAIMRGACAVLADEAARKDPQLLHDIIVEKKVDFVNIPPMFLAVLPVTEALLDTVKTIIISGESCRQESVDFWADKVNLVNAYGPTEATVTTSIRIYRLGDKNTNIGKPCDNVTLYILDENMNPVPEGVCGELYIGGDGLARGYLNQPELTAERFVPNPFVSKKEKKECRNLRIYKTGDICCFRPDGTVEFFGRNDFQLKIRGLRVELEEIETRLMELVGVESAVVLVNGSGSDAYLKAFYVSDKSFEQNYLTGFMSATLPDYMVPSVFVHLNELPLNTSGKIDRKKLSAIDVALAKSDYVKPGNKKEEKVCVIWQDLLGRADIGVEDDFFKSGGNSILAMKLAHRMSAEFGVNVPVAKIFKYKTIRSIVPQITNETIIKVESATVDKYPLSFAQERMFFLQEMDANSFAYNVPLFGKISENVDIEKLKNALRKLVLRHETLRTVYRVDSEGDLYQHVLEYDLQIKEIAVATDDLQSALRCNMNCSFDLREEPPINIWIYTLDSGDKYIFANIHHIAFDGWSADVLIKDLNSFYAGKDLSELSIQYKDYAVWQRKYISGEILNQQLKYWKCKLNGFETLKLPIDKKRPLRFDYNGANESIVFAPEMTKKLREVVKLHGISMYTLLLTCLNVVFSQCSGQEDIVLGTPIANRHISGTEDLCGFFSNTVVLRNKINADSNLDTLYNQIYETVSQAQENQDLPFEKVVEGLRVKNDPSRHSVFQVMVAMNEIHTNSNDIVSPMIDDSFAQAKFDIYVTLVESDDTLFCQFNYAPSLFLRETIQKMIDHFEVVVKAAAENTIAPICELPFPAYSGKGLVYGDDVQTWGDADFSCQKESEDPVDETESRLLALVRSFNEVGAIGMQDDFFLCGGNSFAAMKLAAKINAEFDVVFPVSVIFLNPVVREIAKAVKEKRGFRPLVEFESEQREELPAFYMFPSYKSGAEAYVDLVKWIKPHFKCIGFENYNLYHSEPFKTVQEEAGYYARELEGVKKDVWLFGYSLGGRRALEVAKVLEKNGVSGIKVVLLDTFFPAKSEISFKKLPSIILNSLQKKVFEIGSVFSNQSAKKAEALSEKIKKKKAVYAYDKSCCFEVKLDNAQILCFRAIDNYLVKKKERDAFLSCAFRRLISFAAVKILLVQNRIFNVSRDIQIIDLKGDHFEIAKDYKSILFHLLNYKEAFGRERDK